MIIYLPTFSGSKAWDFFPESAGISKEDTRDHLWRFPRPSEVFWTRSKSISVPVPGRVWLNMTLFPMHFLSKLWDFRKKYRHLLILNRVFISCIGLIWHFSGLCISYGFNNSYFSTRREKLLRKRELAWELAGIWLLLVPHKSLCYFDNVCVHQVVVLQAWVPVLKYKNNYKKELDTFSGFNPSLVRI